VEPGPQVADASRQAPEQGDHYRPRCTGEQPGRDCGQRQQRSSGNRQREGAAPAAWQGDELRKDFRGRKNGRHRDHHAQQRRALAVPRRNRASCAKAKAGHRREVQPRGQQAAGEAAGEQRPERSQALETRGERGRLRLRLRLLAGPTPPG